MGAAGDPTFTGYIDSPAQNANVGTGLFNVTGWFVDNQAQGWAGADDIQVWQGTMDSGSLIAEANISQKRPDVAATLGNPFWAASGFTAFINFGTLPVGSQTLSVYAHTPGKGWWYKQVAVNVSGEAPAASVAPPPPSPAAAFAPAPAIKSSAFPIVVVEKPTSSENIATHGDYTMSGYALDTNSSVSQGSQGTGINLIDLYLDKEPENGGAFLGNADLGFSDQAATDLYGPRFASAGWRLIFHPTQFHVGQHTLFVYAHSIVSGKVNLATQSLNIREGS
jgi:hypothetical protein